MKKILIITSYAPTKNEGFESRTSCIAQEFVKKSFNVTVITSNSNHLSSYKKTKLKIQEYVYNGVVFKILNTLKYKKTISLKRILSWFDFEFKLFFNLKKIIADKPDIIIVSSLSILTILNGFILRSRYPNSKLIFEIRDIWPLTLIEEGGYSRFHPAVLFLGMIEKAGYIYSDAIVGTMPNLVEHVKKITNNRVKNVFCIPFGVYPEDYLLDDNSIKESLELKNFRKNTNSRFTVGYAGSIGLSNGLETFIKVIKDLNQNNELNFVLLGDGDYKIRYQNELSNCSNVFFTGRVEREHVKYYLDCCDVLFISTLPSKVWDFGWSLNKMIDYMISSKPIIAEYDGFKSMINESKSGFFVKCADLEELKVKILQISNMDSKKLKAMGEKGKNWIINNRTWSQIADDYLNIISGLDTN